MTRYKLAELGGDGNSTTFEESFSNLAHAYLRDTAPSLLEYELGFQLLDRNQENTKAVGVLAFKVGGQMMFAPVFFIQGELKGNELLYIAEQDIFVPMKESWLNYLINRKPVIIGTGIDENSDSELGKIGPDLDAIKNPPYSKYASHIMPEVQPFLPLYGHLTTANFGESIQDFSQHCQDRLDLSHFMKQASLKMLTSMIDMFQERPRIAHHFDSTHGLDLLEETVKEAKARLEMRSISDMPLVPKNQPASLEEWMDKKAAAKDPGPIVSGRLEIITIGLSNVVDPAIKGLDEEDAEKLLRDTILIKDHRKGEEVSVPVKLQVESRLMNPDTTGIYEVLTNESDFKECYVIVGGVVSSGRESKKCYVIDKSTKAWGEFDRKDVWVAPQETKDSDISTWQKAIDGLSSGDSLTKDGRYVLLSANGDATSPFRVEKKFSAGDGGTIYNVWFEGSSSQDYNLSLGLNNNLHGPNIEWHDEVDKYRSGARVHLTGRTGSKFRTNSGDVYVPKDAKILKLEGSSSECPGYHIAYEEERDAKKPVIIPGKIIDAKMAIRNKTAALRVTKKLAGYQINDSDPVTFNQALIHLVQGYGLKEDVSRHIIKEAEDKQYSMQNFYECRVKLASPFLTHGAPMAPPMPEPRQANGSILGYDGPTTFDDVQEYLVDDLAPQGRDLSGYDVKPEPPGQQDLQRINSAIDSGQKELFDVSVLSSMLKAVRDDSMIDRYVPDLVQGLDKMGRLLFMFYWHQDSFAERFGKHDLPELEDGLRNAFELLGDVIIFLKQKTIEPYPEEEVTDIDLGANSTL